MGNVMRRRRTTPDDRRLFWGAEGGQKIPLANPSPARDAGGASVRGGLPTPLDVIQLADLKA